MLRHVGVVHVLLDDVLLVVITGGLDAVEELLEGGLGPDGLLELGPERGRTFLLAAAAGALVPHAQFDQHELDVHLGHGGWDGDALLGDLVGHVVVLHGLDLGKLLGDGGVVVIEGHVQSRRWPTDGGDGGGLTSRDKGRDGAQGEKGCKGSGGDGSHGF